MLFVCFHGAGWRIAPPMCIVAGFFFDTAHRRFIGGGPAARARFLPVLARGFFTILDPPSRPPGPPGAFLRPRPRGNKQVRLHLAAAAVVSQSAAPARARISSTAPLRRQGTSFDKGSTASIAVDGQRSVTQSTP